MGQKNSDLLSSAGLTRAAQAAAAARAAAAMELWDQEISLDQASGETKEEERLESEGRGFD